MIDGLSKSVFDIHHADGFKTTALNIFRFQAEENPVYKEYISCLGIKPASVESLDRIPFLPIEFFKKHKIVTSDLKIEKIFESSGTTGSDNSRHYVADLEIYRKSFTSAFRIFYGEPADYFFAALLPSYLEKGNSSLVYMADHLIKCSSDRRSSFFLNDYNRLISSLRQVRAERIKAMLIGVSYALVELAEKYSPDLNGITVVETGGMKGRRLEITRTKLHNILKAGLNIATVHSEYGMTELMSQAWSTGEGIFNTPPWMKIMLREINDPFTCIDEPGKTGGINIIDLANFNSCSFIATGDLGRLISGGGFEVLGRFDNGDLRGCNLLIS